MGVIDMKQFSSIATRTQKIPSREIVAPPCGINSAEIPQRGNLSLLAGGTGGCIKRACNHAVSKYIKAYPRQNILSTISHFSGVSALDPAFWN